jgi:hypothetical protein
LDRSQDQALNRQIFTGCLGDTCVDSRTLSLVYIMPEVFKIIDGSSVLEAIYASATFPVVSFEQSSKIMLATVNFI